MLGWLFGGSKAADSTVEGIKSGLDKLVYTDEEKGDAHRAGVELFIEYQRATQPQNLARRLIAVILIGLFALLVIATAAAWPLDKEYAKFILQLLIDVVVTPVSVIIAFYFVRSLIPGARKS